MIIVLYRGLELFIGLSSGIVIGSAFLALLTFLGVIPRLLQWVKDAGNHKAFTASLLIGTLYGTYLTFSDIGLSFHHLVLVVWGILQGIFNGMLAVALVEVLHVFPIISKRLGLKNQINHLMMAVVFGKIAGSLLQWLYFTD